MRSLFLLAAVCCLVLSACGSPIAHPEVSVAEGDKVVARQAAAAPAPAASDDDDEDDDDDDDDVDLDDPLADDDDDDDDDDDEEEGEDDEDDDYLERFLDDILGGEEEDDDDDEPSGVQPVVAPADAAAAAPAPAAVAAPAAAAEDSVAAASEEAGEVAEAEAAAEGEEPEAGQKEPASAEVEAAAAASSEAAAPAEAEEDEDEEDDIADALDPEEDDDDDDDDDDEEEDDDDDDEDDITDALGRNISVKHSRALTDEPSKKPPVPAVYIIKYNRFIDNILEKMNDVLRRSYDPVSVKLQPIDASKKSTKPKKNKTKSNKRKSSTKKKNTARGRNPEKPKDQPTAEISDNNKQNNEVLSKIEETPIAPVENIKPENKATESRALKEKGESGKAKPTTNKLKAPAKVTKPKKPPTKTTTKKPAVTKNKVKTTSQKSKPRARGTLYGLSSLRRVGDVAVSIMTDHTTVKSSFAVGPLILRVEKEVGRGAKKEIKSATATTAEMTGKISLRVNNQGIATLHSIKVLQPKQVRVDSNHERTRELVWRRSARIAHVVSEKLLSASKPMFHQQTVEKE